MAKDFAIRFYSSKAWKDCRESYKKKVGYLCERCLSKGIYSPGRIVHHKIRITPQTVNDPEVSLNFDNLALLCMSCHEAEHKSERQGSRDHDRYYFDADGKIILKKEK